MADLESKIRRSRRRALTEKSKRPAKLQAARYDQMHAQRPPNKRRWKWVNNHTGAI